MDKDEILKTILRAAGSEAGASTARAEEFIARLPNISEWMNGVSQWLSDAEREVNALPDEPKQQGELKKCLLRYISIARAKHKNNDPVQTRVFISKIEDNWENVLHNKRAIAEIAGGKKGGSKSKRKEWAEAAANKLNDEYLSATKEEGWSKIPPSNASWEIETVLADYEVYRDGENLVAVDEATRKESAITKATFFKEYYRIRK